MVNFVGVPKPHNIMMHQRFVDVVLSDGMSYVALLFLFTPLSIQTMKLTCNVSMIYQIISLLEISYFKSLQKGISLQVPIKARN